ncbi:hypothetical protein NM208_g7066 [Fusarium decemcellulare]|uniref:Uncharacterized protein n=1 Tax=Fusarium decemcellulare TaxID=57161 RepID=A0ACC1SAK5_9HYPO|nr:hypothetical protein NM208_g7066 [Fusarium decemcellulare]
MPKTTEEWQLTGRQFQRFYADLETSGPELLSTGITIENTFGRFEAEPGILIALKRFAPLTGPGGKEIPDDRRWEPDWAKKRGSFTSQWTHVRKWLKKREEEETERNGSSKGTKAASSSTDPADKITSSAGKSSVPQTLAMSRPKGNTHGTKTDAPVSLRPIVAESRGFLFTPPPLNKEKHKEIFGGSPPIFQFGSSTNDNQASSSNTKNAGASISRSVFASPDNTSNQAPNHMPPTLANKNQNCANTEPEQLEKKGDGETLLSFEGLSIINDAKAKESDDETASTCSSASVTQEQIDQLLHAGDRRAQRVAMREWFHEWAVRHNQRVREHRKREEEKGQV